MGFRLTPQEHGFYELFAQSAQCLVDGARELTSVLGASLEERATIAARIHDIEHAADESTHELIRRVNGSFVTPSDREDMHGLASQLDTCMDHMDAAADLIVLYRLDGLPQGVAEQVETLARMADLTAEAMPELRSLRDLSGYWIEVNRLENQADQVYRRLLAQLFNDESAEPILVMKLKRSSTSWRPRPMLSRTSPTRLRASRSRAPDLDGPRRDRGGHRARDGLQLHQRVP